MKYPISILAISLIVAMIVTACDDRSTSPSNETGVRILYPKTGASIGDSITVKVTVGEIMGVRRVDLFIDDDSTFSDSLYPYEFFWGTYNVAAGENHDIFAKALTSDTSYFSDTISVFIDLASGFHLLSEFQITAGSALAVTYDENSRYLFAAVSYEGVEIYDISNPYVPEFIITINTNGTAVAVETWRNYLFIAEGGDGISLWDISDVSSPDTIDSYDTPGDAVNLVFDPSDSTLYAADYEAVQIVQFDDDFKMVPAARLASATAVLDVALNGDYLHLGTADGLRIVDVSDPQNPQYVQGGIFQTTTSVFGIDSDGNFDYLARGNGGITLISVDNVLSPEFAADFNTPGQALAIAFQSGGSPDVLFTAEGNKGVASYEFAEDDSARITALHQFETEGYYAYDIIYESGLILVADDSKVLILRHVE